MAVAALPPKLIYDEKEYVSTLSYGYYPYGTYPYQNQLALPTYIDDNTAYLNEDLYEQMAYDAQVKANLNLLVYGILGGGIEVLPVSNSQKDREVAAFIKRCLVEIVEETPLLTDTLPDLLSCMAVGNRICEIVWNEPGETTGSDRGKWTVRRIKPKDRHLVSFYVDGMMNVLGIVQRDANPMTPPPPGAVRVPAGIVYPLKDGQFKDNFGWMSWRPKNADPRGTSLLASAYYAWWCKQQAMPEWMKYMANFAIGSLWAELSPNADRGARNTVALDGTSGVAISTAADEMVDKLTQFQNMSVMAVPNGTKINTIQSISDGRPFPLLLDFLNTEINKSMTGQDSANTSNGGAGRSPVVGQEIMALPMSYGCNLVAAFLQRFVVNPIIRRNYSRLVEPPRVEIPGSNKDDFLTSASGVSKLLLTNFFPPDTWAEIFIRSKVPIPSPETLQKMQENYWKMLENQSMPQNQSRLASDGQNIQERK